MLNKNLIFGCSRVTAGSDELFYRSLLDDAFELGIRRFDVAPSYGLGFAESVLGSAIKSSGLQKEVAVITKYGIPASSSPGLMLHARSIAKRVVNYWPSSRDFFLRNLSNINDARRIVHSSDAIHRSVDSSFKALGIDRFESLLLHELNKSDLTDEIALTFEKLMSDGFFGSYGVSTGGKNSSLIDFGSVRQFLADINSLNHYEGGYSINVHGAVRLHLANVASALQLDVNESIKSKIFHIQELAGVDNILPSLCLFLVSTAFGGASVIFSTNSRIHLSEIVRGYVAISNAADSGEFFIPTSLLVA